METTHKSLFGQGTTSPGHRIQEKLQMVDQVSQRKDDWTRNSKMVIRTQKTRTECAQISGPEGKTGDRICHVKAQYGAPVQQVQG